MTRRLRAQILLVFAAAIINVSVTAGQQEPPGKVCAKDGDSSDKTSLLSTMANMAKVVSEGLNEETEDVQPDAAEQNKDDADDTVEVEDDANDTVESEADAGAQQTGGDDQNGDFMELGTSMEFIHTKLAQMETAMVIQQDEIGALRSTVTSLTKHNTRMHENQAALINHVASQQDEIVALQSAVKSLTKHNSELLQDDKDLHAAEAKRASFNYTVSPSLLQEVQTREAAASRLTTQSEREERAVSALKRVMKANVLEFERQRASSEPLMPNPVSVLDAERSESHSIWVSSAVQGEINKLKNLIPTNLRFSPCGIGKLIFDVHAGGFTIGMEKSECSFKYKMQGSERTIRLLNVKKWEKTVKFPKVLEETILLIQALPDIGNDIVEALSGASEKRAEASIKQRSSLLEEAMNTELPKTTHSRQTVHQDKNLAIHSFHRPLPRARYTLSRVRGDDRPEVELAEVASVHGNADATPEDDSAKSPEQGAESVIGFDVKDGFTKTTSLISQWGGWETETTSCLAFAPAVRSGTAVDTSGAGKKIVKSDWQVSKDTPDKFIKLEPWAIPCGSEAGTVNEWMFENPDKWEGYSFYTAENSVERCVSVTFSLTIEPAIAFGAGVTIDFLPQPLFGVAISVCWPDYSKFDLCKFQLTMLEFSLSAGPIMIYKHTIRLIKRFGRNKNGGLPIFDLADTNKLNSGGTHGYVREFGFASPVASDTSTAFDAMSRTTALMQLSNTTTWSPGKSNWLADALRQFQREDELLLPKTEELFFNKAEINSKGVEIVEHLEGDEVHPVQQALYTYDDNAVSLGELGDTKAEFNNKKITLFNLNTKDFFSTKSQKSFNFELGSYIRKGVVYFHFGMKIGPIELPQKDIVLINMKPVVDAILKLLPCLSKKDRTTSEHFMEDDLDKTKVSVDGWVNLGSGWCSDDKGKYPPFGASTETFESAVKKCTADDTCFAINAPDPGKPAGHARFYCSTKAGICDRPGSGASTVTKGAKSNHKFSCYKRPVLQVLNGWVMADIGGTCKAKCASLEQTCQASRMSALDTKEKAKYAYGKAGYVCKSMSGARSYAGAPFSNGGRHSGCPDCDCYWVTPGATSVCDKNASPLHQPLCCCTEGQASASAACPASGQDR